MISHHDKHPKLEGDLPTFTSPDWTASALCAQTDPELWFPDKGGNSGRARAICSACPVKAECLEYSLEAHPAPVGVWGGTTEKQRHAIRMGRAA